MRYNAPASLLLAIGLWQASLAASELTAVKADKFPRLDGALDEPFWQKAEVVDNFTVWENNDRKDTTTKVKIAYDSEYIYLGLQCEEPGLASIAPKIAERDGWLSLDESIEIYIAPANNNKIGFHYQISFGGVMADQKIVKKTRDRQWNGTWLAAVCRSNNSWSAEIALPRYAFAPYGDYRELFVNIVRNRRIPRIDQQHVVIGEETLSSSLASVKESFWEPEKYPRVKGIDDTRVKTPFLATIEAITIKPIYRVSEKRMDYELSVTLAPKTDARGKIALTLTDPLSGRTTRLEEDLSSPKTINALVPHGANLPRTITAELLDATKNIALDRREINCEQAKILSGYWDRNYYTTETEARFRYDLTLDRALMEGARLEVTEGKEVLAREKVGATGGTLRVPIATLGEGKHELTLQLVDRADETLFKTRAELIKRTPAPGREWKVDQFDRVTLNNGKPFFPIGFVANVAYTDKTLIFEELRDNDFNFFLQWTSATAAKTADFAAIAEKYGLYFSEMPDNYCSGATPDVPTLRELYPEKTAAEFAKDLASDNLVPLKGHMIGHRSLKDLPTKSKEKIFRECLDFYLPGILAVVNSVKNSKRLVGYYLMDEPVSDHYFNQSAIARDYAARIREADGGYHPIMTLYSSFIPPGDQYVTWADIIAIDPYWLPGNDRDERNTPNFVSWVTAMNDKRNAEFRKVTWSMPMATYWSATTTRLLTPDEQKAQTLLAVIHGATGVIYYQSPCLYADHVAKKAALGMGKMLKKISAAAVGPKVNGEIEYYESALDAADSEAKFARVKPIPEEQKLSLVQACLKRFPSGEYLLLAVNGANYPVNAKFVISGGDGEARELFHETQHQFSGNGFSETLSKYAVRAYLLPRGLVEPLNVKIYASFLKRDVVPVELGYQNGWRPGRKNGYPNPIFAAAGAPNRADYTLWGNGLNHEQALFGKNCVEIGVPPDDGVVGINTSKVTFLCSPPLKVAETYVFSAYLKADRPKANAALGVMTPSGYQWKEVEITNQWQRYYIAAPFKPGNSQLTGPTIMVAAGEKVKIWIDGVQIEKGDAPTQFEE